MSIIEEFGHHYCQECGTDCAEVEYMIARMTEQIENLEKFIKSHNESQKNLGEKDS